jgi:hypothetical protein
MSLILCTGIEPELLKTRKLILEQAGHTVIPTTDQRELTAACEKYCFDVAVIGQTIAAPMRKVIAELIRKHCPSAKILELYPPYEGRVVEDADSSLEVPADIPLDLVERVEELIQKTQSAGRAQEIESPQRG